MKICGRRQNSAKLWNSSDLAHERISRWAQSFPKCIFLLSVFLLPAHAYFCFLVSEISFLVELLANRPIKFLDVASILHNNFSDISLNDWQLFGSRTLERSGSRSNSWRSFSRLDQFISRLFGHFRGLWSRRFLWSTVNLWQWRLRVFRHFQISDEI